MDIFTRSEALLGKSGILKLNETMIAIFGLGGVGGQALETLVRCGIGSFIVTDFDTVKETDLNRQIIATMDDIGQLKTEVAKKRLLSINPYAKVHLFAKRIETLEDLSYMDGFSPDYIIDAIDGTEGKISIIKYAKGKAIPVISSMGTGNRLDPARIRTGDIKETSMCPLAKKMRKRLKEENITGLKTVFSSEEPLRHKHGFIGSVPFVPPAAGIILAAEVIRDILGIQGKDKGGRKC